MKRICALLLAFAAVFALAACNERASKPGSVPAQSVSVCAELSAQLVKIESLGFSQKNKRIVFFAQTDNYAEFAVAEYDDKGEKKSETCYRFYRDKWWYENRGKAEFESNKNAEFDDTMWCIKSSTSILKGKTYAENEKYLKETLKDKYTIK